MLQGTDAQSSDVADLAEQGMGLLSLPAWVWVHADQSVVGRKGLPLPGEATSQLMPIRVEWTSGTVVLLPPGDHQIAWQAQGMGRHVAGTLTVTVEPETYQSSIANRTGPRPEDVITRIPSTYRITCSAASAIIPELDRLGQAGTDAKWRFLMELEPFMERALKRSEVALRRNLATTIGVDDERLLSEGSIESVLNALMFGTRDLSGDSFLQRLIVKCTDPLRFVKVDPERFIRVELARRAGAEVQKKLGDPAIGRKIRQVHSEVDSSQPADVLGEYRRQYPDDKLSMHRLERALLLEPDPMSAAARLDLSEHEWLEPHGIWDSD